MTGSREVSVDPDEIQRLLGDRARPVEAWGSQESELLARFQQRLASSRWENHRAQIERFAHEAILEVATEDDSLQAALNRRRAKGSIVLPAVEESDGALYNCTTHVTAPPFPTGDPLQENFGESPTVVDEPVVDSPWKSLVSSNGLSTFSRLAIPAQGALSLAVGLGKLPSRAPGSLLYPPQAEHPTNWPVPGGILEVAASEGSIGYLHATTAPGGRVPPNARMSVTVDVSIGATADPFYLVAPGPVASPGSGLHQAWGVVHLMLLDSTGAVAESEGLFLEHHETSHGVWIPPIVRRQVSVRGGFGLQTGSWWVYAGISVHLEAQRWHVLTPPPVAERRGFVGIDLRAGELNTHAIHPLLDPGGPITVRRIEMNLCVEPVVVDRASTSPRT